MLINQLQDHLKQAILARDGIGVSTLRLLLSEVKNAQIAKGGEVSDQEIVSIIQREIKKRKEAADSFRLGKREDSARKEESEAEVLRRYLPSQLTNEELTKIVEESINKLGATSIQDMGKVMGVVMAEVRGEADGGVVSAMVKEKLS